MFMLGLDNKKACVRVRLLMRPGQRHYYLAFICQLICDVIMSRSAVECPESTLSLFVHFNEQQTYKLYWATNQVQVWLEFNTVNKLIVAKRLASILQFINNQYAINSYFLVLDYSLYCRVENEKLDYWIWLTLTTT